MTEIHISGLDKIAQDFRNLPIQLGGPVARTATWKACEPIMFEMIRRAPYLKPGRAMTLDRIKELTKSKATESHIPGQLQRSIKRFYIRDVDFPDYQAKVGVGPTAFYAGMVERGHKPNTPAHPFIGPAFDATIDESLDALQEEMGKAIDRTLAKFGWR